MAGLQPLYQDEDLNYFKFSSLVLNEFPKALRQTFKTMWDNTYGHRPGFQLWDDSTAVRNLLATAEGGRTKVPVDRSYEEWDCTALFKATIYSPAFDLGHGTLNDVYVKPRGLSHGHFHPSVVSITRNNEETQALAIDQLRLLRNSLCHSTGSKITKVTFDQSVKYAKDAFQALGVSTAFIDDVGSLSESDFPTNEVHRLRQSISLETVKLDLDELKESVASKDDVAMIKDDLPMIVQKAVRDELKGSVTNSEDIDMSPRKEGEFKGRVRFTV